MSKEYFGKIIEVFEDSPAAEAGIRPGDELLTVNGRPVQDILDYRFQTAEEQVVLTIRRDGERYACFIFKDVEQNLGFEFEEELFDGVRKCANSCIFCFLHQMPKGLRETLYVRDDDFRLSFAHGNYITLTNLSDEDMDRICSQRMSPIYVSVHATEPELRSRMMRNEHAGEAMDQLRRMAEARIRMHTQIVVCPGVNDGEHLERTISDLASLHPAVESIAVVPVGLTIHRERLTPLKSVDAVLAREIVDMCKDRQQEYLDRFATRLVFPADELYLLAGIEFPSAEAYEGFPQFEDGIGVSRLFLDELEEVREGYSGEHLRSGEYVLVTGMLAAPLVKQLAGFLNEFCGVNARVCAVRNRFLGECVTVAGLLAGQDVARALTDTHGDEEILIPEIMLNEERFLDDMTLCELQRETGLRITMIATSPRAVVQHLVSSVEPEACPVSCSQCAGT